MDATVALEEVMNEIGRRIALDLTEQAARPAEEAAIAAGCSPGPAAQAWAAVQRPASETVARVA